MSVHSRAPHARHAGRTSQEGSADSQVSWPVRSGIVPPLAEGFVARPESAPGLAEVLAPGVAVALTPARTARPTVAPGSPDWPGSCGKTQLAVHLAESLWQAHELDLLIWVTATSRATVLSAYAAAAAAIGISLAGDAEAVSARFAGWLAETSRKWLVVLDGLNAPADIDGLWPAGPAGRTLVTTAEPAAAFEQERLLALPITGFSRREALGFLLGRLTEDRGQRTGAIDLADLLGTEPLALAAASAVLDCSNMSCRDYLDLFARKRDQLASACQGRPAAAAISWPLSVEQAYRLLPGGPVQPMLILAAVLDGNWMPGTIFATAAARNYASGASSSRSGPDDGWPSIVSLERAGLLTIDQAVTPPIVRMNAAVQAAIRSAASRDMRDRASVAAADALVEIWPADDAGTWLADSLRSCASCVLRFAGDLLWKRGSQRLLFRAGQSLEHARMTKLAAAHWTDVATAGQRLLGAGHPDAIAAADYLAAAFLAAGRAEEALPWFRRVLADRVAALGPEHPATIEFELRVGHGMLAAERADEAVTLFEKIVSDRALVHGSWHPDVLHARDALADAYCAAGRTADGIRQYQRTLTEREHGQGQSHPATMGTFLKLADAYLAADRIKEAMSAYKRVTTVRERTLGPDHPDTIEARSRLAAAYQSAGKTPTSRFRRTRRPG